VISARFLCVLCVKSPLSSAKYKNATVETMALLASHFIFLLRHVIFILPSSRPLHFLCQGAFQDVSEQSHPRRPSRPRPETRFTSGGQAVANFSVATDETYKDRNGERQKRTEWHKIVVWGKQAEIAQQYLKKGSLIFIEGRIQSRECKTKKARSAPALKL